MRVKKQKLDPDMEQQTGSKFGKEYIKAVYCHPAHLTSMQTASCEIPGWMKHKLHRITRRNVNNLRYADDTTLMAESKAELKSLLMNVKEESEKIGLKLRSWHPVSSLHGKQMEKQWKKITFTIRKAPQLLWHVNLLYTLTCSMALETKKFIPLKHIWVA